MMYKEGPKVMAMCLEVTCPGKRRPRGSPRMIKLIKALDHVEKRGTKLGPMKKHGNH